MVPLEHQRRLGYIGIARVRAAADEHLLHRQLFHILQRLDIVGLMRAGNQRFERGQIDVDDLIVLSIRVGQQFGVGFGALLRGQELFHLLIRGEDGGRCAQLCTHVRDGGTLGYLQRRRAGTGVLIHIAKTTLDGDAAQHFQNDFLCVDAGAQRAGQAHIDDAGHLQAHGHTGHSRGDVHAADADAEHTDGTAVRGVAVTAHADFARCAEAGDLHGVADAVAGAGDPDTKLFGGRLQINVVVRGLVVDVEQVVVKVTDAALGTHAGQADGFERQIGHDRVDVVGQRLIDLDKDLLTGGHAALDIVGFDDFAGKGFAHDGFLRLFWRRG